MIQLLDASRAYWLWIIRRVIPQDYRPLVSDTIVYGLGIAVSRFFGIIVTPLLTWVFAPNEFGVIDTIVVTTALLPPLLSLNLESALLRYYHEAQPGRERRRLISTVIGTVLLLSFLAGGICLLTFQWIGRILFQSSTYNLVIITAVMGTILQLLGAMFLWLLRLERRRRAFLGVAFITVASNLAMIVLFVVVMRIGVIGFFLALLISALAQCVVASWILRHEFELSLSFETLIRCLRFSIPIMPGMWISSLMLFLSRFTLLSYSNLTQVGLFGVAYKIATLVLFIFMPFQMAWQPFSMAVMRLDNAKTIYANVARYVFLALSLIMFATVLFAPEIVRVVAGQPYQDASAILIFLVTAMITGQLVFFFYLAISIAEKPILLLYSHLIALTVFVLSAIIFTPFMNGVGTALAFFCANVALSGSTYLFAQRENHIDYPIRRIGVIVLFGLGLGMYLALSDIEWTIRLFALFVTTFGTTILFADELRTRSSFSGLTAQCKRVWEAVRIDQTANRDDGK